MLIPADVSCVVLPGALHVLHLCRLWWNVGSAVSSSEVNAPLCPLCSARPLLYMMFCMSCWVKGEVWLLTHIHHTLLRLNMTKQMWVLWGNLKTWSGRNQKLIYSQDLASWPFVHLLYYYKHHVFRHTEEEEGLMLKVETTEWRFVCFFQAK